MLNGKEQIYHPGSVLGGFASPGRGPRMPVVRRTLSTANPRWLLGRNGETGQQEKRGEHRRLPGYSGYVKGTWCWDCRKGCCALQSASSSAPQSTTPWFFRRARLGAQGYVGEQVRWVAEFDFAGGSIAFKDVYAAVTNVPIVREVRVGNFCEPFSLGSQQYVRPYLRRRAVQCLRPLPLPLGRVHVPLPTMSERRCRRAFPAREATIPATISATKTTCSTRQKNHRIAVVRRLRRRDGPNFFPISGKRFFPAVRQQQHHHLQPGAAVQRHTASGEDDDSSPSRRKSHSASQQRSNITSRPPT